MARVLDGVRIVELAQGIAGPMAAWFLAELGADICKVEPPAGDRQRAHPNCYVLNRGKQSLVLDPTTPAHHDRLNALLRGAHALILDATTRRAWNLNPDALARDHPGLAVVYAPLYGSAGPYAALPEDDDLLGALSGFYTTQLAYREGPVYLVIPSVSIALAALTAQTVLAGLLQRAARATPIAAPVAAEVSGIRAAYAFQAGAYITPRDATPGANSVRRLSPRAVLASYGFFPAQDHRWLFIGVLSPSQWIRLCACLSLDDFLADPTFADGPMGVTDQAAMDRLEDRIAAIFRSQPRDHWLRVLAQGDVPYGEVASREEFVVEPQIQHLGMWVHVHDPQLGPTQQMGHVLRFDGHDHTIPAGAPPLNPHAPAPNWDPGEPSVANAHPSLATSNPSLPSADPPAPSANPPAPSANPPVPSADPPAPSADPSDPRTNPFVPSANPPVPNTDPSVPSTVPFVPSEVEGPPTASNRQTLPLQDTLIIDLGTFIAGAYASTLLADLGAEVIKVEPLDGDPWRQWGLGFYGWNRGKRSLTLNLRDDRARAAFLRLVARADAVIDNYRPGITARLGITDDILRSVNPDLVNVTVTANGPDGPLADRPAFDPVFQARSGLSQAQGGGPQHEPVIHQVAITDHMTASVAALGVLAGLLARARAGSRVSAPVPPAPPAPPTPPARTASPARTPAPATAPTPHSCRTP